MSKENTTHPSEKGFSLIEIIVSIAILGIIVAAVAPMLSMGFEQIINSGTISADTYSDQELLEDKILAASDYTVIPVNPMTFSIDKGGSVSVPIGDVRKFEQNSLNYLKP